jgi:hypothetical protein
VTHPTADYREPGDAAWDGWPTTLALFVGLIGTMASLFVGIAIVFTHDVVLGSRPKPLWPWVAGVLAAQTVLVTGIVQLTRGAFGEYRQRAAKEANLIANRPTGDPMAKDTTTGREAPIQVRPGSPLGVLIKTFASADNLSAPEACRRLIALAACGLSARDYSLVCGLAAAIGRDFVRTCSYIQAAVAGGTLANPDIVDNEQTRAEFIRKLAASAGVAAVAVPPAAAGAVDYESGLADAR